MKNILRLFFLLAISSCSSTKYQEKNVASCKASEVSGKVSAANPEEIRQTLEELIPKFRSCYGNESELYSSVDLLQVKLTFNLSSFGKVTTSSVHSATNLSDGISNCIKSVMAATQFPCSEKGAEVVQPLNFHLIR
ncbi:MAG: AgmX/PglI C-terminal domain-containing protein [Bacteriovoracaceae bacterium]|nr:AgmX/PglI C-terminal domain-containing protein [Bacteriovoracaceae bacterium]